MEKTKQINKHIITFLILVFGCTIYSCNKTTMVNDDCAMINYAEFCMNIFNKQNLHLIVARSNYYYCSTKSKSTAYIIPNDYKYLRIQQIDNDTLKTIFQEDMIEQSNGDSLVVLLHLVQNLHRHGISEVKVSADTIELLKFNGYYLTNKCLQSENHLRNIKDNWYTNE